MKIVLNVRRDLESRLLLCKIKFCLHVGTYEIKEIDLGTTTRSFLEVDNEVITGYGNICAKLDELRQINIGA